MVRQYWQVAAGNSNRNYSSLFLKHGLAFVDGEKQIQLASEVLEGDVLILKNGLHTVLAAGVVVQRDGRIGGCGDKGWVRDVDGWDLKKYLYVDWHPSSGTAVAAGLTRPTITRTHNAEHRAVADQLLTLPKLPIEPEPGEPTILQYGEIAVALKKRNDRLDTQQFVALFETVVGVYADFSRAAKWTAEETTANLVRPFLRVLGWRDADVRSGIKGAGLSHVLFCFPTVQRKAGLDVKVVECRAFYDGVDLSPEQSFRIGKVATGAQAVAVTNGVALKLYSKPEHGPFNTEPAAYVNLARPSERCPWDPRIHGALAALRFLARPN